MSDLIISVSGLRGIVGQSLTPDVAIRYGCAFAATLPPGPLVITRDGRATGQMLADALRSGCAAVGRDVIDAGVAATPTTGVLVKHLRAAGGIQISASHNPAEYNGLKLFSREGRVIPAQAGEQVIDRFRQMGASSPPGQTPGISWLPHDKVGHATQQLENTKAHLELVAHLVDVKRIRARRFHVLLDANHGAGSVMGAKLLDQLGCRITMLGGTPDGQFAHTPEPTAENLASVLANVTAVGADVGFCVDPDADRLAVIDEHGRYLGEEYTLAMCVAHVLSNRKGPIVTNCSTSRMSEDIATAAGAPFYRTAVGEANVVDGMLQHRAILGGEGNGGVIEPQVGWVRDSFVGMAYLLEAMVARDLPIGRLADELPRYEIVKTKATVPRDKIPAALAALERHFTDGSADRLDGLRLDWPGKWLLVRASNTEPIVRAIAEAPTIAEAQRLCDDAGRVLSHSPVAP